MANSCTVLRFLCFADSAMPHERDCPALRRDKLVGLTAHGCFKASQHGTALWNWLEVFVLWLPLGSINWGRSIAWKIVCFDHDTTLERDCTCVALRN